MKNTEVQQLPSYFLGESSVFVALSSPRPSAKTQAFNSFSAQTSTTTKLEIVGVIDVRGIC